MSAQPVQHTASEPLAVDTPPAATPRGAARPLALVCLGIGLLLAIGKLPGLPTAEPLREFVSLERLPAEIGDEVDDLLLVPLGALLVVFVRLTLGLRMLGPFRPVLIAIGLHGAGVWTGLAFFLLVSAAIVLLRPRLASGSLPYYARLSLLLAAVVLIEAVVLGVGSAFQVDFLQRAVYVPIVVLCLAADGFARALARSGVRTALWEGATTLATALVIYAVATAPRFHDVSVRFPELILIEIAGIVFVASVLNLRLLERINPRPPVPTGPRPSA